MMSDHERAGKQPASRHGPLRGGDLPSVSAPGSAGVLLDRRLAATPPPFGAELVDRILADHGPKRPGGVACKGCGFAYHPGALDCPSASYALTHRHQGIGAPAGLGGEC
jgi:hypothetical protein